MVLVTLYCLVFLSANGGTGVMIAIDRRHTLSVVQPVFVIISSQIEASVLRDLETRSVSNKCASLFRLRWQNLQLIHLKGAGAYVVPNILNDGADRPIRKTSN